MGVKTGIFFITLLVGSFALPKPEDDMSQFFIHADADSPSRIIGGTQAPEGSAPHMVALSQGGLVRSFICGGSIITARTIMTAAHCIAAVFSWGSLSNTLRATVGTNRWNTGGVHHNIARNVTHPNYVSATIKNDIGILITTGNINFGGNVRAVPLNYDFVGAGVNSRATGWGRTSTGGALSPTLLELRMPTIDGNRCVTEVARVAAAVNVRAPRVEPHIELCTFLATNRGMCNGDSGSALVRVDRNQQIGLVSWGIPCARGAPDMFVRISAFRNWIVQNTV